MSATTFTGPRTPVRLGSSKHALPGALPPGERVLWHGAPDWRALARNALHLRGLALYFALLVAWVGISAALAGDGPASVALTTGRAILVAAIPLAVGLLYAWLAARAAAYTITNKRVVIRMGLAVPLTLNLPFAQIDAAGLAMKSDGTGDIALQLAPGAKGLGWFILWPHTRPWHFGRVQPTLRALPDAAIAAEILARSLADSAKTFTEITSTTLLVARPSESVDTTGCHHGETIVAA